MKLYGISNCDTVKKARSWLAEQGISYEFHDFKKRGVDAATLADWLQQTSWEKLVNRSGTTWRKLDDAIKVGITDNASAIQLMQDKTSVIKRPVLVRSGKLLAVGFNEENYAALLK